MFRSSSNVSCTCIAGVRTYIIKAVVNNQFQAGFHVYGLDKDGVGYSMDEHNKDLVTPETLQQAEEAKKKIISGEIKVTDAMTK